MDEIRFDGQVAIVTGAGNGLGRSYSLELARRGAQVVVNDIGAAHKDYPEDSGAASRVESEILAAGGVAMANMDTVATREGGEAIVNATLERFGRVDIVISNAGVMRDRTFVNATLSEVSDVFSTHLLGAFHVLQPSMRSMKELGNGGRIVLTTSTSALYGVFGQAAYASVKAGLIGLTKVISLEGDRYDIHANAIAPIATTRLSPVERDRGALDALSTDLVAPFVAALCHPTNYANGEVFIVGAGMVHRVISAYTEGVYLGKFSAEDVMAKWDQIEDPKGLIELRDGMAIVDQLMKEISENTKGD